MRTPRRSAADMDDVGWPDPALVLARTESTLSWAATSETVSRSGTVSVVVIVHLPYVGGYR
jgi:hypothetical protein